MENFPFMSLPLVVQDIIVSMVVHDPDFYDFTQFATVSQECNWLVQRAKPRKLVDGLQIEPAPNGYKVMVEEKEVPIRSVEQMMILLSKIRPRKLLVHYNFCSDMTMGYFSHLHEHYKQACAFVRKFVIIKSEADENILHVIRDLKYVFDFKIRAHIENMDLTLQMIDALTSVEDVGLYGNMTDAVLDKLAQRTRPFNPIRRLYIVSWLKYSVAAVKRFLKTAYFVDGGWVKLSIDASDEEIWSMFNEIGEFLLMTTNPGEFGYLVRTGITIFKFSNDDQKKFEPHEFFGVFFTVKN